LFAACTQKCYGWFASLQQSVVFARAIIAIRRYFGERVSDVLSPHYSIVCCVATNIRSELARCVNKVSFLVERWIKIGLVRYKRGRAVALSDKNQLDDLGDFLTMRHHLRLLWAMDHAATFVVSVALVAGQRQHRAWSFPSYPPLSSTKLDRPKLPFFKSLVWLDWHSNPAYQISVVCTLSH